jgi:KDO2-lipid IV(A) lauroyltransferase
MSEAERSDLGRRSLQHTACLMMEGGVSWHWPLRRWNSLILRISNEELAADALADGTGVLVLVPHFGNWEFLSQYLGQRFQVTGLYDPPRIRNLEKWIRRARERSGSVLLPISARGLRGFYTALGDDRLCALLPDQVPERSAGVHAEFFGQPALTMTLAHRVIRKHRPRVLIGAAQRVHGGFEVIFAPADEAVYGADPVAYAAALNTSIEALVARDPAQYQWEYKRFKRPPGNQVSVYARPDASTPPE